VGGGGDVRALRSGIVGARHCRFALNYRADSLSEMAPRYLHLRPEYALPSLAAEPFRAVIIAHQVVSEGWLHRVTKWIVASGCLYVIAWGVDWANLEAFDFGDIPDDRIVMTTWHDNEPVSEAYRFAGHCAYHPHVELTETILLHVAPEPLGFEILRAYHESQVLADDA
jgi:hypothetical protein